MTYPVIPPDPLIPLAAATHQFRFVIFFAWTHAEQSDSQSKPTKRERKYITPLAAEGPKQLLKTNTEDQTGDHTGNHTHGANSRGQRFGGPTGASGRTTDSGANGRGQRSGGQREPTVGHRIQAPALHPPGANGRYRAPSGANGWTADSHCSGRAPSGLRIII